MQKANKKQLNILAIFPTKKPESACSLLYDAVYKSDLDNTFALNVSHYFYCDGKNMLDYKLWESLPEDQKNKIMPLIIKHEEYEKIRQGLNAKQEHKSSTFGYKMLKAIDSDKKNIIIMGDLGVNSVRVSEVISRMQKQHGKTTDFNVNLIKLYDDEKEIDEWKTELNTARQYHDIGESLQSCKIIHCSNKQTIRNNMQEWIDEAKQKSAVNPQDIHLSMDITPLGGNSNVSQLSSNTSNGSSAQQRSFLAKLCCCIPTGRSEARQ